MPGRSPDFGPIRRPTTSLIHLARYALTEWPWAMATPETVALRPVECPTNHGIDNGVAATGLGAGRVDHHDDR